MDIQSLPDELARLRTSTGAQWGSIREADINLSIARHLVAQLEAAGVVVDLLPARVPPRYDADAIVAVHADGAWRDARGWKVAAPSRGSPAARALRDSIAESYARVTGLPHDYRGVTRGMRGYFAFSPHRYLHAAAWTTPATIVETGFVTQTADREFLLSLPDVAAQGIAEGVLAFLHQREPAAVLELAPSWYPQMRVRERAELYGLAQSGTGTGAFLDRGARVYPLERAGGWYQVRVRGGSFSTSRYGWVEASSLERY
jgi:N-acetylmuramoyl-L-alanine amidase